MNDKNYSDTVNFLSKKLRKYNKKLHRNGQKGGGTSSIYERKRTEYMNELSRIGVDPTVIIGGAGKFDTIMDAIETIRKSSPSSGYKDKLKGYISTLKDLKTNVDNQLGRLEMAVRGLSNPRPADPEIAALENEFQDLDRDIRREMSLPLAPPAPPAP
jgi:hypothetical protein